MKDINEIIIKLFRLSPEDAEKDLNMPDVPGWDSLTHMDLIVAVEEEYNIQLSGDDIAEMQSFNAIRDIVEKYRSE